MFEELRVRNQREFLKKKLGVNMSVMYTSFDLFQSFEQSFLVLVCEKLSVNFVLSVISKHKIQEFDFQDL